MLFTRKGDDGTSGLFGTPERVSKASALFEALGTVDELNSLLGLCYARAKNISLEIGVEKILHEVQERLFIVQAELAGAEKMLSQTHVDELENEIATIENKIENPHAFVIPGATEFSALCDYARAVSRRAERRVIAAKDTRTCSDATYAYLNRLSSLLYALARYAAREEHQKEISPSY